MAQAELSRRAWQVAGPGDPAAVADLADRLGVTRLVASLLIQRGHDTPDAARVFLKPKLSDLHEPETLPGLKAAAKRIADAVAAGDKIVIYGDYDVDGITATSILWHCLTSVNADVEHYIPHRLEEGYGLNADAVRQLHEGGCDLLITVDCGITACDVADLAKDLGLTLVVTDHHEPAVGDDGEARVPDALCVHPRLPEVGRADEPYGNPNLCGAGVALKLAWGVGQAITGNKAPPALKASLVESMALAALGTVADVVPLTGENRVLTKFGLGGLKKTNLGGLKALIHASGLGGQDVSSIDVGFKLGPRLNAIGRMGHAAEAVHLLTDAGEREQIEIAEKLSALNRERQGVERQIADEAVEQVETSGLIEDGERVLVVCGEGWHPGVVGIVASRLMRRFDRPAVVLADRGDGTLTGSARSIGGFDLAAALAACSETLTKHGGHAMAAGLSLAADRLDDFRAALRAHAAEHLDADLLVPRLRIDAVVDLSDLTPDLVRQLEALGPYGAANPRPTLMARDVLLAQPARRVGGGGAHLQLRLRQGPASVKCIYFGGGDLEPTLRQGMRLDVAGYASLNVWNGRASAELEVKDLREHAPG